MIAFLMDRYEALIYPQLQKSNRADVKSYGLAPQNYKSTICMMKMGENWNLTIILISYKLKHYGSVLHPSFEESH